MTTSPIRIAITGGAGQINYSLLFRIASGEVFGQTQPVILQVIELPSAMKALEGVAMELDDCAFPLLKGIFLTDNMDQVMKDAQWAILVGAKPRGSGMERADLIRENGPIFTTVGKALQHHAAADIRILTVGNPCNTNCLIALHHAPDIPRNRFHALTRLDQNRAMAQLAKKSKKDISTIKNMIIWGNHSANQVPDYCNVTIAGIPGLDVIGDSSYLQEDFMRCVGQRGASIIKARGKSSAASAASAIIDAIHSLITPTSPDDLFSSGVISDHNEYGIPEGLIFSFPCRSSGDATYEIISGFRWDDFLQAKIDTVTDELIEEKEIVKDLL